MLSQVAQKGSGISILADIKNGAGHSPEQSDLTWSCFEQVVGLQISRGVCNLTVSTLQVDDQDCEAQGSMILPLLAVESIFVQAKGKLMFRPEN